MRPRSPIVRRVTFGFEESQIVTPCASGTPPFRDCDRGPTWDEESAPVVPETAIVAPRGMKRDRLR